MLDRFKQSGPCLQLIHALQDLPLHGSQGNVQLSHQPLRVSTGLLDVALKRTLIHDQPEEGLAGWVERKQQLGAEGANASGASTLVEGWQPVVGVASPSPVLI